MSFSRRSGRDDDGQVLRSRALCRCFSTTERIASQRGFGRPRRGALESIRSSLLCSSGTSTTRSPSAVCTQDQRRVLVGLMIDATLGTTPGRGVAIFALEQIDRSLGPCTVSTGCPRPARTNDLSIVEDVPLARGHVPTCASDS